MRDEQARASADAQGLTLEAALKQVREVASTEGTPFEAWARVPLGGATVHPDTGQPDGGKPTGGTKADWFWTSRRIGAFVAPQEAALAIARFELLVAYLLGGHDPRLKVSSADVQP